MPNEHKDPVQEARELLARATPGPWAVWDSCSWRRTGTKEPFADGNVICPITQSDGHPDLLAKREDLELAARAPELLRLLADECERLREVIGYGASGRLTPESVSQIKTALRAGASQKYLAKKFGVTQVTVSSVQTGRTWGNIK